MGDLLHPDDLKITKNMKIRSKENKIKESFHDLRTESSNKFGKCDPRIHFAGIVSGFSL